MKEVTGQNLGMFWTKVGWAVLGQVNDLQMKNKTISNTDFNDELERKTKVESGSE